MEKTFLCENNLVKPIQAHKQCTTASQNFKTHNGNEMHRN